MDLLIALVLVAIGIAAGLIASIVGGAAVIVYPAMIAVGIPPQAAAVANIVSITPGTMLAALSDRFLEGTVGSVPRPRSVARGARCRAGGAGVTAFARRTRGS